MYSEVYFLDFRRIVEMISDERFLQLTIELICSQGIHYNFFLKT